MMDIKDPEQKKSYFTFVSLAGTPVFKIGIIVALFTLFSWGMYLEVLYQVDIFPLGLVHSRNLTGFLSYSMTALLCACFSGTILYRAYQAETWSHSDRSVFWGGILLGYLFFISGFEFILYGEWQYRMTHTYLFFKFVFVLGIAVYLILAWKNERIHSRDEEKPSSKPEIPQERSESN
ncbi:MAG: hypothetical protein ACOX5R_22730 [bacterium]|jgi:hypothetical protein